MHRVRTERQKEIIGHVKSAMLEVCKWTKVDLDALLDDYEHQKGKDAVCDLCGFLFYVENVKYPITQGMSKTERAERWEKVKSAIKQVYGHDINHRGDRFCEPRSTGYSKYIDEYIQ